MGLTRWPAMQRDKPAQGFDPYLFWAERTQFQGFRERRDGRLRVAIEFADEAQARSFAKDCKPLGVQLSRHYRARLGKPGCRFVCARVPESNLASLAPLVKRFKPGLVGTAERGAKEAPAARQVNELDSNALRARFIQQMKRDVSEGAGRLEGLHFFPRTAPARSKTGGRGPMVAVIDFGCAFAHPHFRFAYGGATAGTRIAHFWDQGRPAAAGKQPEIASAWPWQAQQDFGYGREASRESLDTLMQSVRSEEKARGALDPWRFEEACYVAASLPELLEPWSHGTAVLDLAAGWPHPHAAKGALPDAAAAADLVFVQLAQQAIEDLSGGWVTVYVLDAIEYVIAKAGGRPVVVNISLGSHGGPHDGDSLLEAALEQYTSLPGVAIVLAAGNAADKKGHASARIDSGTENTLIWAVPSRDPTQSFLEFWYPQLAPEHEPVFEIVHEDPSVGRMVASGPCETLIGPDPCQPLGAFVHAPTSNAGRHAGMALLALAPTFVPDGAAQGAMGLAPSGNWRIRVCTSSPAPFELHAWVERDEPGAAPFSDRASSILVAPPGSAFTVTEGSTLTGQATGSGTIVVGGYLLGTPLGMQHAPAPDSGRGPARDGRRHDVDALAPSDLWKAGQLIGLPVLANLTPEPGRLAPGLASDGTAGLSGTSLAAPWVARQVCNAIAADPTLDSKAKVCARLRESVGRGRELSIDPPILWT